MSELYTAGGDEFQLCTRNKWAGQTFRPQISHILHLIDVNLKGFSLWPRPVLQIFNADAEHKPVGEALSRDKWWLVDSSHPQRDWLWFETWGKTLNENHFWLPGPPLEWPDITLNNSQITLVNTGRTAQWINTIPSATYFPLLDEDGLPLYVHHCSPVSTGHPEKHWHSYVFIFQKEAETWYLEAIISHGTDWAPLDDACGETPLGSAFYEGQGPNVFNLTEKWIHCRTYHGLDADPTGWKLSHVELRIEDKDANPGGTLVNNYVAISRKDYSPAPPDDYLLIHPILWLPWVTYRMRVQMTPVELIKDCYYAMILIGPGGLPPAQPCWQYDKGDATYPRGIRIYSPDTGATWEKHYDDDHIFVEFGTPTVPPPVPPPPTYSVAILDVEQIITRTGYKIVVHTNTPCRMFMFYTLTKPAKHTTPILRRGVVWKDAVRFCFVTWFQNEQEEAGDTLTHTFIKEPWPHCQTRWFCFRYMVNNEWSPSVSAIFKKHRFAPYFWQILFEPWQVSYDPPPMTLIIEEPWEIDFSPPDFERSILEPWTD